ncbi:MAG: glycosyltransferase [Gallionella sp.]|nr:glycosyltransferase [Gallionella sp.]
MKVLFLTWDGPQVNYLESLFLPIFVGLKDKDIEVEIIQFTWAESVRIEQIANKCAEYNIPYTAHHIMRTPKKIGALLAVLSGIIRVRKYLHTRKVDVLLTRSILPSVIGMLAARAIQNVSMVFDGDGLPYDERVDFSGMNPSGFIYRLLRDWEAQIVRSAKSVITRSAIAADILHARAGAGTQRNKFYVVNNGRNIQSFCLGNKEDARQIRAELGWPMDCIMLVYAGSLGAQYCEQQMVDFFRRVSQHNLEIRWLILSGDIQRAEQLRQQCGGLSDKVVAMSVDAELVPRYLGAADLGLSLRRTSYSMRAVSPVKLGEYLLCGLPAIASAGIGDTDSILDKDVGFWVDLDSLDSLQSAAEWFVNDVLPNREKYQSACRRKGLGYFALDATVGGYATALNYY